jgi:hypothetical protein
LSFLINKFRKIKIHKYNKLFTINFWLGKNIIMDWEKNKQILSTGITYFWKLATGTDKTMKNELFWVHKMPLRFGKENHGRVYTRKEEEGATKKEMGSGYQRRIANECIGCGTSCLWLSGLQKGCKGSKVPPGTCYWMNEKH